MFCLQCNAPFQSGDSFCRKCGCMEWHGEPPKKAGGATDVEQKAARAALASLVCGVSLFLPWLPFRFFRFEVSGFAVFEVVDLALDAGWTAFAPQVLFGLLVASFLACAFFRKLSESLPVAKFAPLLAGSAAFLVAALVVFFGIDAISVAHIFAAVGFGFYLFAVSSAVLFFTGLSMLKKAG